MSCVYVTLKTFSAKTLQKTPGTFLKATALIIGLTFCATAEEVWEPEESWKEKGFFGTTNYYREAVEAENDGDYSSAADKFQTLMEVSKNPGNKTLALYHKGLNQEKAGDQYDAYKTYNKLLSRFGSAAIFDKVLQRMIGLGDHFAGQTQKMFSNSREKAIEIYGTILRLSPYGKNSSAVTLKMARLEKGSIEEEGAIGTYKKLIKDYRQSAESADAYLELASIYNKMSIAADGDGSLAQKAYSLISTYLRKYPTHTKTDFAKALLHQVRCRIADRLVGIGEFYTWEANRRIPAARRYLHEVLRKYDDTPAAYKAEQILLTLDPNFEASKIQKAVKDENGIIVEDMKKFDPFKASTDKSKWEKRKKLINPTEKDEKWLLPLENIKGDEK